MLRKTIKLLMITSLCGALCLAGCGKKEEPVPELPEQLEVLPEVEEEPEETASEPEESTTSSLVIEERTVVNGEIQSYLTGEWTS